MTMEKKKFNVTLSKAQKLYEKLKVHGHISTPQAVMQFALQGNITTRAEQDQFVTTSQAAVLTAVQELHIAFDVADDLESLRESIFHTNQRVGASKKMSELKLSKRKLDVLTQLFSQSNASHLGVVTTEQFTNDFVYEVAAKAAKEVEGLDARERRQAVPRVSIRAFDVDSLKATVNGLRTRINELEDELASINSGVRLDVELSHRSQDLLGLT
jgi:hypothetical protein